MQYRHFFPVLLLLAATTGAPAFRAPPTPEEMAELTRQIADDPGNSRNLQYRGLNYAILGEKDKAIADYKAAEKLTADKAYLYWSLGWALLDLGDYASALQMWQAAATLYERRASNEDSLHDANADMHWVPYTFAMAYWGEGNRSEAFQYFTISAKQYPAFRNRTNFESFTDHWTQKEQAMGLQLFDAWQKEVDKPGSHLW